MLISDETFRVNCVAFAANGQYVATGDSKSCIRIWETKTGRSIHILVGHADEVVSLEFSADSCYLLSGSVDWTVRLWDVQTGNLLQSWEDEQNFMCWGAFAPDGHDVLIGGLNGCMYLRNTQNSQITKRFTSQGNAQFNAIRFAPNQQQIATGDSWGNVRLWDVHTQDIVKSFTHIRSGIPVPISSVDFSPDTRQLLTCDATVHLWALDTGLHLSEYTNPAGYEVAVFSPNGQSILAGSADGTARVWDAETNELECQFIGHSEGVVSVAFSPDGRYVLTASNDGTARLWDRQSAAEIYRLQP